MTTNDPYSVLVSATIDIHTAINAVREFAGKYPIERLSVQQANELIAAAQVIVDRLKEQQQTKRFENYACPLWLRETNSACGKPSEHKVKWDGVTAYPCHEHLAHYLNSGNPWKEV